jgi:23S rRNA (cytosine1962-C5)-methyltransferase
VLGTGVADPENEVFRVLTREALDSLSPPFFEARVQAAWGLRRALGLVFDGQSSWRLINGEGDGLSGFAADIYGPFAVLYVYSKGLFSMGRLIAQAMVRIPGLRGVVVKLRAKGGARPGQVKQEIVGEEPPEKFVALDRGVRLEVHLLAGLNVGLFTDLREHRGGMHRFSSNRRVLNTFAYTGAISVAAALGGAASVTSVDLSSGVLKWAMENFRLNGLDPEDPRFRFESQDVMRFLEEAGRSGTRWDTIVLDPPTFSAARAAGWSMKNDYPDLIQLAVRALAAEPVGFLWVSANVHRGRALLRHVEEGLEKARRPARILEIGGLPPDYPTMSSYPEGRYLEVVQVAVGGS